MSTRSKKGQPATEVRIQPKPAPSSSSSGTTGRNAPQLQPDKKRPFLCPCVPVNVMHYFNWDLVCCTGKGLPNFYNVP